MRLSRSAHPPAHDTPRHAHWCCLLLAVFVLSPAVLADESRKRPPSPVTLTEVKREVLREQVKLSGTAVPWRKTLLSPPVAGLVVDVKVDEGSRVSPGDKVLILDDRLAEIDIESAQARVSEARARQRDAVRKRDELLRLKKGRHASQTALDTAVANVETRSAALTREQVELNRARELAERHKVFAPFSGMVVSKRVEVGQWVQRDDPVIELVSTETLRIRAALPQRFYVRLDQRVPALVRFDALPERTFEGRVFARLALGDDNTRSFPLLIDIPNPDGLLAPGMSARVQVQLQDGVGEVLTVPRDAVVTRADGSRVLWRVKADGGDFKARAVTIETGRARRERVEVTGVDLRAGDRVVLLGNENLRPGQRVDPRDDAPAMAGQQGALNASASAN